MGIGVYLFGHPKAFLGVKKKAFQGKGESAQPVLTGSNRKAEVYAAHAAQAVNFVVHRAGRAASLVHAPLTRPAAATEGGLYAEAVERAFSERNFFITTGSPHSRACYLRNFAWFYPTLLDPATVIDGADLRRRRSIVARSLAIILETMRDRPYTTTLVPVAPKRFAAVNYVRPPSDSLLGVLAGLRMLIDAGAPEGMMLLEANRAQLAAQVGYLLDDLKEFRKGTRAVRLIDRDGSRSTATDTRLEKRRFVTNANVWASFRNAVRLGIVSEPQLRKKLGASLAEYKHELLEAFGSCGIIANSLDAPAHGAEGVTLDFAHVHDGFWSFETPREIELFRATADAIIGDLRMHDLSGNCFLVSAANPRINIFEHFAVAAYHGRTVWPAFNAEFADRLIDLAAKTGEPKYRRVAERIVEQLERYILVFGGYPEVLGPDGRPYSTWLYHSARADSWFPRFAAVRARLGRAKLG